MDTRQEQPKCFCARCCNPIEGDDKVNVGGQNFHKQCCIFSGYMCCVCRSVPASLRMFYGHVFCNKCFKNQLLYNFDSDPSRMQTWMNNCWMQTPGMKHAGGENKDSTATEQNTEQKSESGKKCICAWCQYVVDDAHKININGLSFHRQCARCYFCHCKNCSHGFEQDKASKFFKNCFDQWQNNTQFAEMMKEFMAPGQYNAPFIFMRQGTQHPFGRCGHHRP